jgi:predicted DNA-binding protein
MSENREAGRTVSFRISEDLYDRYAVVADRERRKMSDVFRIALEDHVGAMEKGAHNPVIEDLTERKTA